MKVDPVELAQRMERFERACRRAGIKVTHQRSEVFREVAGSGEHPDAERVHRGVRRRLPTISLDTVYRTLWLLTDLGQIAMLGPMRQKARFDANLDRHHHFVCRRCGLTQDFYSEDLDDLPLPRGVGQIGRVERTHVEVRGLCRRCVSPRRGKRKKVMKGKGERP